MNTEQLIQDLRRNAKNLRSEGCCYTIADLMDEAADQLAGTIRKPGDNSGKQASWNRTVRFRCSLCDGPSDTRIVGKHTHNILAEECPHCHATMNKLGT